MGYIQKNQTSFTRRFTQKWHIIFMVQRSLQSWMGTVQNEGKKPLSNGVNLLKYLTQYYQVEKTANYYQGKYQLISGVCL